MDGKEARLDAAEKQQPPTQIQAIDDFPAVGPADVAVFWDYENFPIPAWCPATTASEGIRNKVAKYDVL